MRVGTNPSKGSQAEIDDAYHRIVLPVYIPQLDAYFEQSLQVLQLCLNSLDTTVHEKTRITVVSNGSCEAVNSYLNETLETKKIHELIIVKTAIGKINSIFRAVNNVNELYVTIADADVLFTSGWQTEVEQVLEDYPKVGMVCPFSYSKGFRELTANMFWDNMMNGSIRKEPIVDSAALAHFAHSIGNPTFYNSLQKKCGIVYQKGNKSKVFVGAGHFVATFRTDIFDVYTFQQQIRKLGNGERKFIDTPAVNYGLWRVSTYNNYVYHMGNTVTELYTDLLDKNVMGVAKTDLPKQQLQRQSKMLFLLKNKLFARFFFSNTVFVFFLTKIGFTKTEALAFIKS